MAQETIPRNRMPVPEGFRVIPPAIDEQDFGQRRERLPQRRRGGVGVGVGAVLDPIDIAEELGTAAGEIVGDVLQSGDPELLEEYARNERELRRRQEEHERQFEQLMRGQIEMENAIPGSFEDLYSGSTPTGPLRRFPQIPGRMRPFPKMPAPPPPSTRRRGARLLQRIQRVTSNPYGQLGVLGLGVLGGRRSRGGSGGALALLPPVSVPEELPPIPAPLTPNESALLPYWSPVTGMSPASSASQRCDCKPKKRGPRRKCKARAPVRWAGGPRKGKAAGTRCIRWEN